MQLDITTSGPVKYGEVLSTVISQEIGTQLTVCPTIFYVVFVFWVSHVWMQ